VPDHQVAEIIDGVLYVSPRPAYRHARAAFTLGGELYPFHHGKTRGGWWLLSEPEFHFGDDVVVPDLAGWRVERMPIFPIDAEFGTLAPDWVCEVLSPSTKRLDRTKKRRVYVRERVKHGWFLDPIARTLEVYEHDGTDWTLHTTHHDRERVRAAPFEALALDLALLWGELPNGYGAGDSL